MDRLQADAVARALLAPDVQAQEDLRRKRAQDDAKRAAQRRHANFVLVGYVAGAALGHFVFGRIVYSGLMGAFAGMLVSVLAGRLGKRGAS